MKTDRIDAAVLSRSRLERELKARQPDSQLKQLAHERDMSVRNGMAASNRLHTAQYQCKPDGKVITADPKTDFPV
ncbi:MAG: hypothetical protein LBE91_15990 [Tannerella sp.]|nr:hypothetical protein [Tannerella sp.]